MRAANPGTDVEIVTIKTSGDRGDRDRLGAFVREIQYALLANEIDFAQHCLKDLPTQAVPGLTLAAHLEREDPRDTLISRGPTLLDLPQGSVIGTGSVRRTSQLAAVRPDLVFRPLVGNVDTRMRKLMEGEYDAIVLAIAGLRRLGVLDDWAASDYASLTVHSLDYDQMLPAPGQGVIVLETRVEDAATQAAVRKLHDEAAEVCTRAEREFLASFGGGCSVPVAAMGLLGEEGLSLTGLVASPDGKQVLRGTHNGEGAAQRLAKELGTQGAFEIVSAVARPQEGFPS